MIVDYSIYVTAEVGKWASNTYPDGKKWIVELQGVCKVRNRKAALVRGVIAGLSDLEHRCNIHLFIDDDSLVDIIAEIALGLNPQSAAGIGDSALERLIEEIDRHNVVLCYWPKDSRAKALRKRLDEI
ncbi:MAG: hypothetical protein EBR82_78095 [Caulobacteraceae bacterium]|nr:hypothetical protein [Caulobacteraceae bacterium]